MCGGNSSNIWNDIKWLCYIISWSYMLYHIMIMLYHITITISTNRSQGGLSNVNEVVRNLLIIIGWKTASNTPLGTPLAPVPPVGEYYHSIHQQLVLLRQVCNNHGFLLNNVRCRWYSAYFCEFFNIILGLFFRLMRNMVKCFYVLWLSTGHKMWFMSECYHWPRHTLL